jgi:hypothetical protein
LSLIVIQKVTVMMDIPFMLLEKDIGWQKGVILIFYKGSFWMILKTGDGITARIATKTHW